MNIESDNMRNYSTPENLRSEPNDNNIEDNGD